MSLATDLKEIGVAIETIDLSKHGNYYSFSLSTSEGRKFNFYTPLLSHHYFHTALDLVVFIDKVVNDMPIEFKLKQLNQELEQQKNDREYANDRIESINDDIKKLQELK